MAKYSIENIIEITKGKIVQKGHDLPIISHLQLDSRRIFSATQSIFIAIKGDRQNGHDYLVDAFQKGIRAFIVHEEVPLELLTNAWIIQVPQTTLSLQFLASYHRNRFKIPVVGITGSNGKTIVKEWLYQLLKEEKRIVKSPKSYNSQIGVPLSVWQMEVDDEMGIFEAGISEQGEMSALQRMIQPTCGILTNLGAAHDENFDNWEDKAKEKLILFEQCNQLVYCKDYSIIHNIISQKPRFKPLKTFTWSRKSSADLMVGKIEKQDRITTIQGIHKNQFIRISIPFSDSASIENAINCWAFLLQQGYNNEWISEKMISLTPVAMRLELKEGINQCSIINDYYNSDLGSLEIALDFINQQIQQESKTVILSDILQTGKSKEILYSEVANLLKAKGVSKLIGIGPEISTQSELFDINSTFYESTQDFLNQIQLNHFHNETILLKGARTFGFEKIGVVFQKKVHETVLEINLNAIVHNLNYFKSKLLPDTKIMAMVKAFSYGSGSFEIANILQFNRVDYLAVAYVDEGVDLRKAGISIPIMVMNPDQHSYDVMIQHQLEPEIYSFKVLALFEKAIERNGIIISKPYPVHIKLDTGMRRLGFETTDIQELSVRIKNNKKLEIKSVFSHLATADDPNEKAFTLAQIELFKKTSQQLEELIQTKVMKHILNSHGICAFPDAQFDMTRLGIGLYGISSFPEDQKQLQPVGELKSVISQIKHVPAGQSVGYSRKGIAETDQIIATIPIGYADGLRRSLSNRKGVFYVNGKPAPIVGNVCMDMCMIDVTEIPCIEGDEVIIFGKNPTIQEFAASIDTIEYEALTSISPRVKRVYFQE